MSAAGRAAARLALALLLGLVGCRGCEEETSVEIRHGAPARPPRPLLTDPRREALLANGSWALLRLSRPRARLAQLEGAVPALHRALTGPGGAHTLLAWVELEAWLERAAERSTRPAGAASPASSLGEAPLTVALRGPRDAPHFLAIQTLPPGPTPLRRLAEAMEAAAMPSADRHAAPGVPLVAAQPARSLGLVAARFEDALLVTDDPSWLEAAAPGSTLLLPLDSERAMRGADALVVRLPERGPEQPTALAEGLSGLEWVALALVEEEPWLGMGGSEPMAAEEAPPLGRSRRSWLALSRRVAGECPAEGRLLTLELEPEEGASAHLRRECPGRAPRWLPESGPPTAPWLAAPPPTTPRDGSRERGTVTLRAGLEPEALAEALAPTAPQTGSEHGWWQAELRSEGASRSAWGPLVRTAEPRSGAPR